VKFIIADTNQ